jgi:hypothetical protein
MVIEMSTGEALARVRSALVHKDLARTIETDVTVVLSPVAPPRLWGMVTQAAIEAIQRACEHQPRAGTLPARCAEFATRAITHLRARLIEPNLTIDAHVAIAVVVPRLVHLALTGGVRAYRVRNGTIERLQSRAEQVLPLGVSAPQYATESFDRGDWLLLGTPEAFSIHSVSALSTLLGHEPDTAPSTVRDRMLLPAHQSQRGGAIAVLRSL